jgi:hypothetical protein
MNSERQTMHSFFISSDNHLAARAQTPVSHIHAATTNSDMTTVRRNSYDTSAAPQRRGGFYRFPSIKAKPCGRPDLEEYTRIS